MTSAIEISTSPLVLVTGGCGYLGSVMVPLLLEQKIRVRVVDCCYFGSDSLRTVADHPSLELVRSDLINFPEHHPELLAGVSAVVHLASISNDPSCDLDPNLTIRTNYNATTLLARAAAKAGCRHFIFMSSCSIYGTQDRSDLLEDSPAAPVTLYALTKSASERELLALASPNFSVSLLRAATLFGLSPRMRFDLAINVMIKRCLRGEPLIVNGAGSQYRPFVHVRDMAEVIFRLLTAQGARAPGEVFNVVQSKLNLTILDLARTIQSFFPNSSIEWVLENADIRSYRVNGNKLESYLQFSPQRGIKDAVEELRKAVDSGELTDLDNKRHYNLLVMREFDQPYLSPPVFALPDPEMKHTLNSATAKPTASSLRDSSAAAPIDHGSGDSVPTTSKTGLKIYAVILAYNCETMLTRAYQRIPKDLVDQILVMDDCSSDATSKVAAGLGLTVYRNKINLGYGGNLKAGLERAFRAGADYVVEVHGDGAQFNPESLREALPLLKAKTDLILGSRFIVPGRARELGMPLIRYTANRFLSFFDRIVLGLPLSEFHTGFRIYSRKLYETLPFEGTADNYLFSFQVIAQAAYYGLPVREVPVEADYISAHTSHSLSGAAVYAIQTFGILGRFIVARAGVSWCPIFPKLN